ncbi:MAG: RNase adapter RapZ [Deltaproteobacteria bacterium]|nr:RNase adapter RapZ [Deltaproteobacteria bacterium]
MKSPLVVIITGLSGSGKSTALKVMEDSGFFCMDNIPIDLLMKLTEVYDFAYLNISKLCIGMDVRGGAGQFLEGVPKAFDLFRSLVGEFKLVFLEADKDILVNRFKETRRRHPLSDMYPSLMSAIDAEISIMYRLKHMADYVLDTSHMNIHELEAKVAEIASSLDKSREIYIQVISFGFKKGIPIDADILMDVRFLPNPYFEDKLKDKTGRDRDVKDYIRSTRDYKDFIERWRELIRFIVPRVKREGRSYFTIAIGCTGGRHRSVSIAEETGDIIRQAGFNCEVRHRDLD